jgi:hypothetical protein
MIGRLLISGLALLVGVTIAVAAGADAPDEDGGGETISEPAASNDTLTGRITGTIEQHREAGYRQDGQPQTFLTTRDRKEEFSIEMAKGVGYMFVIACGSGCDKVSMTLSDGARRAAIASATDQAATASVPATVAAAGTYAVSVSAPGCRQALCTLQTVVLLRDVGPPGKPKATARSSVPASKFPAVEADAAAGGKPPQRVAAPVIVAPAPTAPPVPMPAADPFGAFDNFDMEGFDIGPIKNTSAEACAAACLANPACRSYSFDKWNMVCFPKAGVGELVRTARSVTGLLKSVGEPQFSKGAMEFERFRNKRFPGGPDGQAAASFEACQDLCLKGKSCVAFTFLKSSKMCQLLPRTDVYQPDPGADSGAKRQKSSAQ